MRKNKKKIIDCDGGSIAWESSIETKVNSTNWFCLTTNTRDVIETHTCPVPDGKFTERKRKSTVRFGLEEAKQLQKELQSYCEWVEKNCYKHKD